MAPKNKRANGGNAVAVVTTCPHFRESIQACLVRFIQANTELIEGKDAITENQPDPVLLVCISSIASPGIIDLTVQHYSRDGC